MRMWAGWGEALGLLVAVLLLASAQGGSSGADAAAFGTPPQGGSLEELMGMLDKHSSAMSVQQLGELRAMMRQMRGSKQRQVMQQQQQPSAPPSAREFASDRKLMSMEERASSQDTLRAAGDREIVQAFDPVTGAISDVLAGNSYGVILYPLAPFVIIKDPPPAAGATAVVDPGNVLQTRSPSNGMLSGLTVDLLETMSVEMGVTFRYYYPCRKAAHTTKGICEPATASDALNWLKTGDTDVTQQELFFGNMTNICGPDDTGESLHRYQCFVASATKITASRVQDFRMTQPFMDTGFSLVVKESPLDPPLMSAFLPFTFDVWIMIIFEIIIMGMALIYVEGYGTNEALWGAADVSGYEGCAKINAMIVSYLVQLYDSGYWATTMLLGSADKAPTTSAGRVLVTTQLFFALILMSLYTGGVATFLMMEALKSAVTKFSDYTDTSSMYFNKENDLCVPSGAPSVKAYLDTQKQVLKDSTGLADWKMVPGTTIEDCVNKVYLGEAVGMFYDSPVLSVQLADYKMKGMCGKKGGFCEGGLHFEKKSCEDAKKEWTSERGTLGLVGNVFNPFGYGLAFKRGTAENPEPWDYVGFSMAIQALRDNKVVAGLEKRYIPNPADVNCAAGSAGPIQLSFANISGLFTITLIILIVGTTIGMMETIIAACVKICPCCGPKDEDEGGGEEGEEEEVLDEEEEAKKEEIHKRITELQERLLGVEATLGVEDAPEEEGGGGGDDGGKAADDEHFFSGFFKTVGIQ